MCLVGDMPLVQHHRAHYVLYIPNYTPVFNSEIQPQVLGDVTPPPSTMFFPTFFNYMLMCATLKNHNKLRREKNILLV